MHDVDGSSSLSGDAWAITGDMAFGPTSIAGALLGLGAVPADVANTRAIVALGALDAIARQVAYTTASVTSFGFTEPASTTTTSTVSSSSSAAPVADSGAASGRSIRARARNMPNFATTIAFGPRRGSSFASSSCIGAVPGNVAWLTALVASFSLGFHGAITGYMAVKTAVIAGGRASFGASCCLMAEAAAIETSASTRHFVVQSSVDPRKKMGGKKLGALDDGGIV